MTSELIERVARAIDAASKNARLGQDWEWFIPEAQAAIAAIQADAAPVADSEDWRKAWRNVALLSSEHEDVRLNEAVAELHSVFEAYAHPPVADRVSTSSPVDDRAAPKTSGKLRDAVEVWRYASDAATLGSVKYKPAADEAAAAYYAKFPRTAALAGDSHDQ